MQERQYNRLINEKSPYLLQHAENPVDWYPWGDEAFERARAEDKPVFLSVGYSTCHWCHVMEEESFSDPEVAELMNASFVSVKVDREERPDIDSLYMNVSHMLSGAGGWPLTVLMTPDKLPFFAGTYYPKHSMGGRIGMMELIPRVMEFWRTQRDEVLKSAQSITDKLDEYSETRAGGTLTREAIDEGARLLVSSFDPANGGFGGAPKFPMPHYVMLLLRQWHRTCDAQLLQIVERTLDAMRCGGIHDHLGGGFHRYSTDQYWRVPHYEKMLHDQALLAMAYLEAHQATGRPAHAEAARGVFDFVLRDMTSPEGGFYSALNADSEGEEGRFYLWREDQIRHALKGREADAIIKVFNVSAQGNFHHEVTGEATGDNVLYLHRSLDAAAQEHGFTPGEVRAAMHKLYQAREQREHPSMDDKVIADWNGMMIAALARGHRVLGEGRHLDAARRAADFILTVMRDEGGGLLHRWREGEAALGGMADDYAYMTWALIELYEAGFDPRHLGAAVGLMDQMVERFWREPGGGFYFTPEGGGDLPLRRMETYDGAVPAANSVALYSLARLAALTGDDRFTRRADALVRALAVTVLESPSAHAMFLVGLDAHLASMRQVAVVGRPGADDTRAMLDEVGRGFHPDASVVFVPADEERPAIREHAPYVRSYTMDDGHATAYVCIDRSCQPAVTDVKELGKLLEG